MARVARPGARAIVSLVHPNFYRTGTASDDEDFQITTDLGQAGHFPIRIGAVVGPFTYYLHQPPAYLNAFVKNGWALEHAEDAFIPRAEYEARYHRRDPVVRSAKVSVFTYMIFRRSE